MDALRGREHYIQTGKLPYKFGRKPSGVGLNEEDA